MKNICDWNKCNKIGEYRAPVEKDNSKKYRLLCLNHVFSCVFKNYMFCYNTYPKCAAIRPGLISEFFCRGVLNPGYKTPRSYK